MQPIPQPMSKGLTQLAESGSATQQAIQAWLSQGSSTSAAAPVQEEAIEERRFLRFALGEATDAETALLPLDSIQEVSQISQQALLPVPGVPNAVLGVANCRGTILWLVELTQLLGQPSLAQTREAHRPSAIHFFHTLTIQAGEQRIGLVVPRVMDIESFDAKAFRAPTADLFPSYLLPFLAGYLQRSPVLSASALLENLQMQR